MSSYLPIAKEAAQLAGAYLKANFGKQISTEDKESHHSIVTAHDIQVEKLVIDLLRNQCPSHGILSEEAGLTNGDADYIWVIDPLDGSSYYARGIETFSISIALMYKGQIILGVVYLPIQNELFTAEQGKGAYLSDKPIHVSAVDILSQSMGSFGHRYIRLEKYQPGMNLLLQSVRSIRGGGSCAMELCYLACGRQDIVLTVNQSFWDYAAGALIVQEAGGVVSDINNKPIDPQKYLLGKYDLLASNELLHKVILDKLA